MSIFELKVWDDNCKKVTIYTVKQEESLLTETDYFFERYGNDPEFKTNTQDLTSLIFDAIGDVHGAIDDFFRPEDNAEALPPKGKIKLDKLELCFPDFPLRLYAYRIPERTDILILFNGGIKTAKSNIDSGELNMKFNEARVFAKRIEKSYRDGTIIINEESRKLTLYDGSEEIFI